MAATVYLSESNGAIESVTDNISNMNFGALDAPNIIPSQHPIGITSSSVAKWWRVKLAVLGGSSQISNIRIWKSSGTYVTGEAIGSVLGGSGNAYCASYAHAESQHGGGAITVPYSGDGTSIISTPWSSRLVPTSQPGSGNVFVGGTIAAAIVGVGYSNYTPFGMNTTASTPVGPVNQKVFTVQYDEA